MGITGTDAYGSFTDTGVNTTPTVRASVEVEAHYANEIDTGSKTSPLNQATSHRPHREPTSPR